MSSTLVTHSGRIKAQSVTYDQLATIPVQAPMGRTHQPVPHNVLVDALVAEAGRRGFTVSKEQFAVGANGAALFGVLDLARGQDVVSIGGAESGLSLGFRSGNDQSMAIKVVAGRRVFVCDNLALSGDMVALVERHTIRLDLAAQITHGFERFLAQASILTERITGLQSRELGITEAKALIYDIFTAKVMPMRLLDDVGGFYFNPGERIDCQPRTMWGLHNAFTRALQQMPPVSRFGATLEIGRRFGLVE